MGYDSHTRIGDPGFDAAGSVSPYFLSKSSPAVDAAILDPDLVPDTDLRGVKRPAGTWADIGAFEYSTLAASVTKAGRLRNLL